MPGDTNHLTILNRVLTNFKAKKLGCLAQNENISFINSYMTIKNWHDRLETIMTAAAHITNYHLLSANHQVAQNSGWEKKVLCISKKGH